MFCLGVPLGFEFVLRPELFSDIGFGEVALHILEETCMCVEALNTVGRHRVACPRLGLLPERNLAPVCREAGASVMFNVKFFST